ncbi:MAG: hypothetical protein ACRDV9_10025 [Acidimicrobiia bacterium]
MRPRRTAKERAQAHPAGPYLRSGTGLFVLLIAVLVLHGCAGKEGGRRTGGAASSSGSSTTSTTLGASPTFIGQRVDVGEGGSITVHALQLSAPGVKSARANAGNRFVAVDAEGCTGPKEVGLSFAPDYFELEIPGQANMAPAGDVKRPAFVASVLSFGQCARGWITYEVPRAITPRSVVYEGARTIRWEVPEL